MSQAADKQAFRGKIHRAQLGVGFHEECFRIQGNLVKLRCLFRIRWLNGGCQVDKIRIDSHFLPDGRFKHLHHKACFRLAYHRFVFKIIANENNAHFTSLFVQCLPFPGCTDITVENKYVRIGFVGFNRYRLGDGSRAADIRAIWPGIIP